MTTLRALACLVLASLATPPFAQGGGGAAGQDTSAPVEVSAEELNVDQETGAAVFTGNVVVSQGGMRLSAPRVLVTYREDRPGIERMEATGGVTLLFGPDAAEGRRAEYSIDAGLIVISGDVLLTRGRSAISSERMTVNLEDGTARMQGGVRTILRAGDG